MDYADTHGAREKETGEGILDSCKLPELTGADNIYDGCFEGYCVSCADFIDS